MEKKQGMKGLSTLHGSTLREENTGLEHVKTSSVLKMKHLQRLATWAAVEVGIPSLGALFGNRLATNAEASGIPLEQSTSLCQRCESFLKPGLNCTVRIEKPKNKAIHRKKKHILPRNNVVYTCHFCSPRNLKGGTPKGHVKGLLSTKHSLFSDSSSSHKVVANSQTGLAAMAELDVNVKDGKIPLKPESIIELKCSNTGSNTTPLKSPITPLSIPGTLSKKKRKENVCGPNNFQISEAGSVTSDSGQGNGTSNKRRRKGWTKLKEIAESIETENRLRIGNFSIPFLLQCDKKDEKMG